MYEMLLILRREQLTDNYWANMQGHNRTHPIRKIMQECWKNKRSKNVSFGWVCEEIGNEMGLQEMEFSPTVPMPARHLWFLEQPTVNLTILNSLIKAREESNICEVICKYLKEKYLGCLAIYTGQRTLKTDKLGWHLEYQN